ncbi:HigA family addiction module antitoxin [Pelagibius sp.]|uniref:HigA family addiction module antitoxin n=1 Tax=Pelagibius sp. TaxID=1931238 RepID=UPI0026079871|nr:HigA family addiction module antitoxin [Pelagibius sp.]
MSNAATMAVEHPSVFIREELEARGWSQVDLAYILGISTQQLSPLLNGKRDISPDMAVALGDAFDVPGEFFANLQMLYDLNKAKKPDPGVRTRANWISTFPIREMIRRGWIEDTEPDLLDLQMMRFFNTNSVQEIPFIGAGDVCGHAAKKSAYEEITPTQLVWLHRVRVIARTMDCPAYSRESLIRTLSDLRAHMNDKDDLPNLPHLLWKCGVRFVIVEPLDGSKIDGVCTWLDGQPVIGISTRLNRMDNLCFVIRHEIEHVIREDGKQTTYSHVDVFEPDRNLDELPEEERRADEAAAEFLIPQDKLASFMARKGKFISERDVLAFAARHHIHPSVVVGQIQYRRHLEGDDRAYSWLRKYLTGIRGYLQDWEYRDGWGHVASVGL